MLACRLGVVGSTLTTEPGTQLWALGAIMIGLPCVVRSGQTWCREPWPVKNWLMHIQAHGPGWFTRAE